MKLYVPLAAFALLLLSFPQISHAQEDDPATSAKLQFSSVLMGTLNSFSELKGTRVKDDDHYVYYDSESGLGTKWLTILNSKSDTTQWFCFVRYHMIDDMKDLIPVQTGVFALLNMVIGGGKIKGSEGTEGNITTTNLYATADNAWLGELVSDGDKKTFHILMKNTKWK